MGLFSFPPSFFLQLWSLQRFTSFFTSPLRKNSPAHPFPNSKHFLPTPSPSLSPGVEARKALTDAVAPDLSLRSCHSAIKHSQDSTPPETGWRVRERERETDRKRWGFRRCWSRQDLTWARYWEREREREVGRGMRERERERLGPRKWGFRHNSIPTSPRESENWVRVYRPVCLCESVEILALLVMIHILWHILWTTQCTLFTDRSHFAKLHIYLEVNTFGFSFPLERGTTYATSFIMVIHTGGNWEKT